ncbi:TMEM175 family protein [Williamsia sp. 1135]|uniref:TMEM175 family protein n=1 Tax=Williamsia sp. 1135 TaxID=1889262 RepID=UPI000A10F754|nr:TMEM175 family protein [Williamsia sp. 1135]ORM35350.1 hypothetical protein BFL43_09855 [Williamsia sp. 1135]
MSDGDVRTERGLERLIFFTDAVVAIAITLVVLPLVDEAKDLDRRSVAEFLSEDSAALIAATISFAVIGAFWRDHHRLFERASGYTPTLLRANSSGWPEWCSCRSPRSSTSPRANTIESPSRSTSERSPQ